MVLYLPTYVRAPAVTPLPYGLLSVAQDLSTADADQVHWRNGVQFQPDACDSANTTLAQCPVVTGFSKTLTASGVPARGSQAFTVYADIACSPVGNFWQESEARVTAQLTNGEGRALEAAFWTGNVTTPSGGVVYPHLAANTAVFDSTNEVQLQTAATTVVTGVDIVEGLGLLEEALAHCYGGIGTIHAPRRAIASMSANFLIERVGQRLQTTAGTPVAFGAGYTGSGPDGSSAPNGMAWIYATGAVAYRRSGITITSDRTAALDRSVNTLRQFAERTYVISWDCCHLAVLVNLGGVVTGSVGSAT